MLTPAHPLPQLTHGQMVTEAAGNKWSESAGTAGKMCSKRTFPRL